MMAEDEVILDLSDDESLTNEETTHDPEVEEILDDPDKADDATDETETNEDDQEQEPQTIEDVLKSGQYVPVAKVSQLRQRARAAEERATEAQAKLDELSNSESPLEKWVKDHDDDEPVPGSVQVAENRFQRNLDKLERQSNEAKSDIVPLQEHTESRNMAISNDEEAHTLLTVANRYMSDDEAGKLGAAVINAATDADAVEVTKRLCRVVLKTRAGDYGKSLVKASQSKKSSKSSTKQTKPVETDDNETTDENEISPFSGFFD